MAAAAKEALWVTMVGAGSSTPRCIYCNLRILLQYHSVSAPEKLAAYAVLAGPALTAGGGVFLARGEPVKVFEASQSAQTPSTRTVIIKFPSAAAAIAAHDSPAYQAALKALDGGAVRDLRIVELA